MTNNNSNNIKNLIIAVGSIAIFIFTIISALWVGREIGKAGSKLIEKFIKFIDKIFEKKAEEKTEANKKAEALKAAEPFLKQAIKNVKPIKFVDLEKTMGSVNKVVKEVINENLVPENIKEKIENEEAQKASGTKTFINGKNIITALTGANDIEQFIYDCKELKRSKIGSHRVPNDSVTSHWDIAYARLVKKNLTQAEEDWAESFELDGFTKSKALDFVNKYFTEVNNYIRHLNVNVEKVSFEETDSIINKYFGEI